MVSHLTYSLAANIARPLRSIYLLFVLLMCTWLLVACGGGAGTVGTATGKNLYTTAPGTVNIAVGNSVSYEIGGGTATYKANSGNVSVATVEVKGTSLSIKGISNGTAQIVVSDATGAQVDINVTVGSGNTSVDLFVTAPSNLTISTGLSNNYVISGGKPGYFVSSSNTAVATVGINSNNFFITGIKAGSAQVIVLDSTGTALTINVTVGNGGTVIPLYVSAAGSINSTIGEVNEYIVGGGNAPYLVTSNNKSVATASLVGNTISVKGIAKGSAQIMVFDATGASVSTTVVVDPGGLNVPLYVAAANAVNMEPGARSTYSVGGGVAPYFATSSNINVANVSIANNTLTFNAVSAGTAQILVFDAVGTSVSIALTVGSGGIISTPLFVAAPTAVTIAPGINSVYNVGGGKPPYIASSSNTSVASVGISNNKLTISTGSLGTAQIVVFDANGTSVSIDLTVGSSGGSTALYTTAGTGVVIPIGSSNTFTAGGGKPPYRASSSNSSVVSVPSVVSGTDFTISGLAAGSGQISIFDSTGTSVSFSVTVSAVETTSLFTTAGTGVVTTKGSSNTYTIGGGKPPYSATSSNTGAVAISSVSGTNLTISSIAVGSAQVSVYDSTGTSVSFSVTVNSGDGGISLFTTAGNNVTLALGSPETYLIGGGVAPYRATSSTTGVASVTVSGGTNLVITPVAQGSTVVTVFDSSGNSVTVGVTITATTPSSVDVLPNGADGNIGDSLKFLVSGGTPPYAITVNNPSIASVSPSLVTNSGDSFNASLLNVGSTTVTIKDAAGQIKTITLNASQINTTFRLSPSTILVGEDSTNTIDLNIFGGAAPYRAFTSDQTLSSVTVTGSVLSVGLGTNSNRCINPIDSSGVRIPNGTFDVTITVLDSLGASATSVITIKDNGLGNGSVVTQPFPFVPPCN